MSLFMLCYKTFPFAVKNATLFLTSVVTTFNPSILTL